MDHVPIAADLGGPVIIPVMLVTLLLSSNCMKMTARLSGTCSTVLPHPDFFTRMADDYVALFHSRKDPLMYQCHIHGSPSHKIGG